MLLLIRHALVDACGRFLAGRLPGIHLNADGRRDAKRLGDHLRTVHINAIYTSPRERARETAQAMLAPQRTLSVADDLDEVNFGDWTGLFFSELDRRSDWHTFNQMRSITTIPGGESMADVQRRAFRCAAGIAKTHGDAVVALVSHADVLRALIAHVIGVPLDRMTGFQLDPASVSVLVPVADGFSLSLLNASARGLLGGQVAQEAPCAPQ